MAEELIQTSFWRVATFSSLLLIFAACNRNLNRENQNEQRPNIIFILADDLGFSDIGSYGSEIETPNLDRLAENGIRFTQAYNAAVCYPSRAALLTGAYPHQVGMMSGPENITGAITLGDMFKMAGYRTLWSGKHHGTQSPLDLGFDRYYGLRDGCSNYFNPGDQRPGEGKPARKESMYPRKWIIKGELLAPYTPEDSDFYVTTSITDKALQWLEEYKNEDRPFFLYLAHQAPHDPLQAWPEEIEKYLGTYMNGYEEVRKARCRKQKENGLLGDHYKLSKATHRDWDTLSEEEKLIADSTMAVYAAMIDKLDHNIGRVLDKVKELGEEENTLVFFASDNGAAHQVVTVDDDFGPIGSMTRWTSLGPDWANVANTPLRKSKVYSHEGGIRTPLIAYWPAGIKDKGRTSDTPVHFIDFMPTFAELAGVELPRTYEEAGANPDVYNNEPLVSVQGISIVPILKGNEVERQKPLYWQLRRGKALRDGNWKIVTWNDEDPSIDDWELYNMKDDPTEMYDLSEERPDILDSLAEKHDRWGTGLLAVENQNSF